MGISGLVSLIAALVVGGGIGTATLVGVVNSETSPPSQSPASVNEPIVEYGSNN